MPLFVELPPQTYGMFSIDLARVRICPRIAKDGSTTSATTGMDAGDGGGGTTACGPFAFVGSAVSVASDEKSRTRTADHWSSSAMRRTTTARPVVFAKW